MPENFNILSAYERCYCLILIALSSLANHASLQVENIVSGATEGIEIWNELFFFFKLYMKFVRESAGLA